ncbi:LysM peptidoglycan-binding domain-containing C40 family peptidase [Deinococcus maricopensis]|uniref:NLP/P60 protein n=1 Tax=Deinococcus maricopensis (strain DSM 21211 / LMG 22137 / NRRL B-23946 / LB-34) TaxID=709986 RepID=E8U9Y7_DEIML|nr:LysM peptidoglycan-binding domain-containing C40 family peptidase [Deinococcus maricopensis]ADV67876.1 NLP/P60 protein [Deinococcus maricopensis DSM 21211]
MKTFRALILAVAAVSSAAHAASTYTVKPGDTLYKVAQVNKMDPVALMKLNGLNSTTIQVGQKLKVSGATATASAPQAAAKPAPANGNAVIRTAASRYLNIRYVLGGTSARGIDCSGYTQAVFKQLGVNLPRTARSQFGVGRSVPRGDLRSGDLVFFNTTGAGVSHVGIYLGNGEFANANSYQGRTIIEKMNSTYWATRYVGARRVL